ncbi:MAG TPA: sulfatase [Terriglobales bacterium]|nr:sulfatase [Terriglobales bacterium]
MKPHFNSNRKSLILVTVDCLRADHVGFMGYARPTTPFLDSLAKESCVFRSATTAGAPTYFSLPAILGARYPLSLGREVVGIALGESTLASVLRAQGYATACFNAANPYISELFGYHQGFDVFEDFAADPAAIPHSSAPGLSWKAKLNRNLAQASQQLGPLSAIYEELYFQYCQRLAGPSPTSMDEVRRFPTADVLVSRACDWLDSIGNQPFFLWLHLMDPHAPYYPADQAMAWSKTAISPSEAVYLNSYWNRGDLSGSRLHAKKNPIVELYDAAVYWVDEQLMRLAQRLMNRQRWHDCAMAVTADHGEEFLDHGGRYHAPHRLHEELIHVPLLLRVPGLTRRAVEQPFSLLHLAPTLLDAIEVKRPQTFSGASHWPHLAGLGEWHEPCIAEAISGCTNPTVRANRLHPRTMAVREGRYKLHLQFETGCAELFDLEADPKELRPIAENVEFTTRRRLLEVALDHLERSVNQRDTLSGLRSKLRQLQLQWPHSLAKSAYT